MKRCQSCGGTMEKRKLTRAYHYTESGLKNVLLDGLTAYYCSACDKEFPEIPSVGGLHAQIADSLLTKKYTLTGLEFRFLRKEMRMKAKDLAMVLGVTQTTVSRWETGEERIGVANDRLIRSLYILWLVSQGRVTDPAQLLDRVSTQFPTIHSKPKKVEIRLPANLKEAALVS